MKDGVDNIATINQRAVVDTDIGNDNARDREKAAGTRDLGPVSVSSRDRRTHGPPRGGHGGGICVAMSYAKTK